MWTNVVSTFLLRIFPRSPQLRLDLRNSVKEEEFPVIVFSRGVDVTSLALSISEFCVVLCPFDQLPAKEDFVLSELQPKDQEWFVKVEGFVQKRDWWSWRS